MIKLPITEKAQEYCEKVKVSSDARKQLDEGWQKHYDIEVEDAFHAGAIYVLENVNKPKSVAPNPVALAFCLAMKERA